MNNLPISISTPPAKAAGNKSPANNESSASDAQGFGNVLARQVADAAKPAESMSRKSADNAKSTADQDNAETTTSPTDSASSQPADMLATLLAQGNLASLPEPANSAQADGVATQDTVNLNDSNSQLYGNSLIAMNTGTNISTPAEQATGMLITDKEERTKQAAEKNAMPPGNLSNDKSKQANLLNSELNTLPGQLNATTENSSAPLASFKKIDPNELSPLSNSQQQRAGIKGELGANTPLSGSLPLLPAAATTASSPQTINTPLTQTAWADDFSQKITWMATQRNQSAELHLNPPQLGPLDVVLKMNGDQASAIFTSPHAAVREAIEQAMPKLREMLADSGIMLGNAMVNDQAAKNNQENSSKKSQERASASTREGITEVGNIQEARVSAISRHNGLVDTFA